jgi:hypothetical protein
MAVPPADRSGTVAVHRSGERWTVEVQLEQHTIGLHRAFPSEDAARRAGEQVVAEWQQGDAVLRDLLLRELAAAYRTLRERFKTMQPATVPATRTAWERAIGTWEQLGWIAAPDAARYREHVHSAFEAVAAAVRRHRLAADAEYDPTS